MKSSFVLAIGLALVGVAVVLPWPALAAPTTTFTVNSTLDLVDSNPGNGVCQTANGVCTLRAAIQEANATAANDTIILPAGTYALTITGQVENAAARGDLDILNDLTLQGAGANTTIVDARKIDRAFEITATAHVTLTGLTIQNGSDNGYLGGGILANGPLTLIDDRLIANFSSASGGAITSKKSLVLVNTDVISNRAGGYGGGIQAMGLLTITGGQILSNSVSFGGGGVYATGMTLMRGTLLRGNRLESSATSSGGGINFSGNRLELIDVTLISNTAQMEGGGLSSNGTTILSQVLISGNAASDGSTHGKGGGLCFRGTGVLELSDVTISHNQGTGFGGGIFTEGPIRLNRVTLSDNHSGSFGGGLFISGTAAVVMTDTTISGNRLDSGAGGGIYNVGSLSITNITVVSNTAPAFGSAIYNAGTVYMRNSIIARSAGSVQACNGAALTSYGHNLDNDGSCGLTATGDLSNTNPLLGVLRNNGGATWTHALSPASPAIDHGDNVGCPDQDQRGILRPLDGDNNGTSSCDIGAYEYGIPRFIYLPLIMK